MEDYTFHEEVPGEVNVFDFAPSFFHNPEYLTLKRSSGWKWYYASRPKAKKVALSLYLHIDQDRAESSIQSPFGTIESAPGIPPETLYEFLEFVEAKLRASGVSSIRMKTPPFHYNAEQSALLHTFMFNRGYSVVDAEVGAVRFATSKFEDGLNRLEKRQLKKCSDSGLSFTYHPSDDMEKIYSFILECRQLKGYTLSMTLDQLLLDATSFPKQYLLVGVYQKNELVAASIAVKVTSDILYNFYADHNPAYDEMSPVVLVVKALYEFCREHNMKMLDMGTSAVNGKPNFGLLNFKMRLGGVPSPKLTFEKVLSA